MKKQIVAHRGGGGVRPENTLAAFDHAIGLGCFGAELDVHLTKDKCVVVHHDKALNPAFCRHLNGAWIKKDEKRDIRDLNYSELMLYEIGFPDPASNTFRDFPELCPAPDQRIPLLRDVIRLAKEKSTSFKLIIEIKSDLLSLNEEEFKDLVDHVLFLIKCEGFEHRAILCSFDWRALIYAKNKMPDIKTWFTTHPLSWFEKENIPLSDIPPSEKYLEKLNRFYNIHNAPWYGDYNPNKLGCDYASAISAAGGDAWFMYYSDFDKKNKKYLLDNKLTGIAWSVNLNDTATVIDLLDDGLDGFCTDYPDSFNFQD